VVDPDPEDVDRSDNFRPDYRIPPIFRADLVDFRGSGYDRGHLVASANQRDVEVQNSETFLLSNMSPQHPQFNRRIWKELEQAVRNLNASEEVLETFVVNGPIFNFDEQVMVIGDEDEENEVTIPVPHAFFKSILTEDNRGRIKMWSFILPNRKCEEPLEEYLVPTTKVEQWSGVLLWDELVGEKISDEKERVRPIW
jgi:endonuclease G